MNDIESIYSEDKYGIVRWRNGTFTIGKYNFIYQGRNLNFFITGITTEKKGISGVTYSQWTKQMYPNDYPFEISEEVFNKINTIIRNNVAEVKNILSLQPEQKFIPQLNSKFFIKTDRFYFVHSIIEFFSSEDYGCCDQISIGENEFLMLDYVSPSLTSSYNIEKWGCFYLSDFVYDYIKEKTFKTLELLKNLCASIYEPSPLDVPTV